MKKLVLLAVVLIGFAATSFAQTTATATALASASIQPALNISSQWGLSFGNIFTGTAGTVTVTAASTGVRSGSTGMGFQGTSGVTSAKFIIAGESSHLYNIVIPNASLNLTNNNDASATMLLDGLTVSATSITTAVDGTASVYMGGTLHVAATQATGNYSNNADLKLTVNHP